MDLKYQEQSRKETVVEKDITVKFENCEAYICSGNCIPENFDAVSISDARAHQILAPARFKVQFKDQNVRSGMNQFGQMI